eukprot:2327374-Rhodomonas_salina.1
MILPLIIVTCIGVSSLWMPSPLSGTLPPYACAVPCPIPSYASFPYHPTRPSRSVLRVPYAMYGTDTARHVTLGARPALSVTVLLTTTTVYLSLIHISEPTRPRLI